MPQDKINGRDAFQFEIIEDIDFTHRNHLQFAVLRERVDPDMRALSKMHPKGRIVLWSEGLVKAIYENGERVKTNDLRSAVSTTGARCESTQLLCAVLHKYV